MRAHIGVATIAAALLAMAGCGGSSGSGAPGSSGDNGASAQTLAGVYSQVNGLTGQARFDKLLSLAKKETGSFTVYMTSNQDVFAPEGALWKKDTGISIQIFRAGAADLLQRLSQESQAGKVKADVVATNPTRIYRLAQPPYSIFSTLKQEGPLKDLKSGAFQGNWIEYDADPFVVAWNSTKVATPPTTWQDLCTKYKGTLAIEGTDWPWFATLVQWFEHNDHMTSKDALGLASTCVRNAKIESGHSNMTDLVVSGEVDITADAYSGYVNELISKKAPIAWKPHLAPFILQPDGMGITKSTKRPATALLYLEYFVSEPMQKLIVSQYEVPMRKGIQGDPTANQPTTSLDASSLVKDSERWQDTWDSLVKGNH